MDVKELRALQAPLKERYQQNPESAIVTARAEGIVEGEEIVKYKDFEFTNPQFDPNRQGRNAQHELAQALKITAYPTIVFFNENGDTLLPIPGYKTPAQLELYLKLFYNNDHETISSQEDWDKYQEEFVFQFKS